MSLMKEQLWISDTGKIVCERVSCTGETLLGLIAQARHLQKTIVQGEDRWSVLSGNDLHEFGALLAGSDKTFVHCDGGHVSYDIRTRQLLATTTA